MYRDRPLTAQQKLTVALFCMVVIVVAIYMAVSAFGAQQQLPSRVIFTQGPTGRWGWQVSDPAGEFLAGSPHDNFNDQPEAAHQFAKAKSAIQGSLYTIINPLPPPAQTVLPPAPPPPIKPNKTP